MKERIRIALIGCGRFCQFFVPLFQAHPFVEEVYVCDERQERVQEYVDRFHVKAIDSFETALKRKDINAIGIFTPRTTHGPMAITALKHGKNVYSAVPCAVSIDEIFEIERLVRETGLTYSMGETGYYRAASCFCRREFAKGTFGKFVYAEAQYNHDIRNMEQSFRSSGGEEWKKYAGIPPMFYPTHSTSMILSTLPGVHAKKVVAFGFRGSPRTDIFGTDGQNLYNNPFSNTAMLLELSNGGLARVSENRCLGWRAPETYISQFYGTDGGYEFSVARHHLSRWDPEHHGAVIMKDVTEELQPENVSKLINMDYSLAIQAIANSGGLLVNTPIPDVIGKAASSDTSPVQPIDRLPEEYRALKNGHNGTHQFLIDDFCRAVETGKLSPTNIWEVARYNIPGLLAHQSALQGGVTLEVPDLGAPPKTWKVLWQDESEKLN